jgi:hypothetical protein
MPDLSLKVVDMHDDGLHSDGLADVRHIMTPSLPPSFSAFSPFPSPGPLLPPPLYV